MSRVCRGLPRLLMVVQILASSLTNIMILVIFNVKVGNEGNELLEEIRRPYILIVYEGGVAGS